MRHNKSFGAPRTAHGRIFKAMQPSKRRPKRIEKHARLGPFRDVHGERVIWHTTRQKPWVKKASRRAANKVARASRKANR